MKKVELKTPSKVGENELWNNYRLIDNFVFQHWDTLYEGAVRMGLNIEADYYAPQRISLTMENEGQTRLHRTMGLKYVNGWKYNSDSPPSDEDLEIAIKHINRLIVAAESEVKSKIKIVVK